VVVAQARDGVLLLPLRLRDNVHRQTNQGAPRCHARGMRMAPAGRGAKACVLEHPGAQAEQDQADGADTIERPGATGRLHASAGVERHGLCGGAAAAACRPLPARDRHAPPHLHHYPQPPRRNPPRCCAGCQTARCGWPAATAARASAPRRGSRLRCCVPTPAPESAGPCPPRRAWRAAAGPAGCRPASRRGRGPAPRQQRPAA
jgi:hypothetical protein